jgi:hypothetical protein
LGLIIGVMLTNEGAIKSRPGDNESEGGKKKTSDLWIGTKLTKATIHFGDPLPLRPPRPRQLEDPLPLRRRAVVSFAGFSASGGPR